VSINFQNLFASGGRTPYNWSVTGGARPPGLRVIRASNGNRIEGTPTARGTFTFNLTVRDQDGPAGDAGDDHHDQLKGWDDPVEARSGAAPLTSGLRSPATTEAKGAVMGDLFALGSIKSRVE
jgi:Putative Ig domain